MDDDATLPAWLGTRAYDRDGQRLGHVADVLFDERTHRPGWVLLVLLRASDRLVLAPARGLVHRAEGVVVDVAREAVRSAPVGAAPPGELGRAHGEALSAHYGVRVGAGPWRGIVDPELARAEDRVRLAH